jgi:hypothetical protein
MNIAGWRGPQDRTKARQGWLEGPVIGVQCRAETTFGSQAESVLDAIRELGGMLLLAQERDRQGKTETRAGEGKWWTTKPRWGGGPGGEIGEATGASETLPEGFPKAEEKPSARLKSSLKDRRRPSPAEIWKALRPGSPLWDPKIVYEAIGKDQISDWDEVSHISSFEKYTMITMVKGLYGIVTESSYKRVEIACAPVLPQVSFGRYSS